MDIRPSDGNDPAVLGDSVATGATGATGETPFRIARRGSRSAAAAATLSEQAMREVELRFRSGSCSVAGFINSALAADPHTFDKVTFRRSGFRKRYAGDSGCIGRC